MSSAPQLQDYLSSSLNPVHGRGHWGREATSLKGPIIPV